MTPRERLVKAYVNLIKSGKLTLDNVLVMLREDVEKALIQ